jgi:NAD(P)H-nitrite reductase large subunit
MRGTGKTSPPARIQYVIIGNSAAGISAARQIRRQDARGRISILSDESGWGYSRVLLPLYIAGKISRRRMIIAPREEYASLRARLLAGDPVVSLDPGAQRVHTRKGASIPYDRLLIATGSSPRVLEVPGNHLPGIHYLRKFADAEGIRKDLASTPGTALVVGGGLVSLKTLEALLRRRRKVHLVISSDRVLSQMLDRTASRFFLDALGEKRVSVHLGADVRAFEGNERVKAAHLSDGSFLPCSLVVIGKGVRPNVGFLRGSGVRLREGIVVDARMATGVPSIYAAGDVAESPDILLKKPRGQAIWPLAVEGGRVAGSNMAFAPALLPGGLRMNAVELLGKRAVSVGAEEGERVLQYSPPGGPVYRKLIFSGERLTGFLLAGDIRCAGILTSLVKNETPVSESALEEGLELGFSYAPRLRILRGEISPGAT